MSITHPGSLFFRQDGSSKSSSQTKEPSDIQSDMDATPNYKAVLKVSSIDEVYF